MYWQESMVTAKNVLDIDPDVVDSDTGYMSQCSLIHWMRSRVLFLCLGWKICFVTRKKSTLNDFQNVYEFINCNATWRSSCLSPSAILGYMVTHNIYIYVFVFVCFFRVDCCLCYSFFFLFLSFPSDESSVLFTSNFCNKQSCYIAIKLTIFFFFKKKKLFATCIHLDFHIVCTV